MRFFEDPEMEVVRFVMTDVITTSSDDLTPDEDGLPFN